MYPKTDSSNHFRINRADATHPNKHISTSHSTVHPTIPTRPVHPTQRRRIDGLSRLFPLFPETLHDVGDE